MNDDNESKQLESILRRNVPAAPSADLMKRLMAARPDLSLSLVPRTERIPFFSWFPVRTAAAAVIAAAASFLIYREKSPLPQLPLPGNTADTAHAPRPEVAFFPALESRQSLLAVKDLGIVKDSASRPVRLISTTWLDENTYGTNAPQMKESRIRREITPILLQTY